MRTIAVLARTVLPVLFVAVASLAGTAQAHAPPPARYLKLVNRAHDSIVALAVAAAGSDAFRELPIGAPLGGGGRSTTVAVAGEDCRYDVRLLFRDGRTQIYRDVDLCRYNALRVRPLRGQRN